VRGQTFQGWICLRCAALRRTPETSVTGRSVERGGQGRCLGGHAGGGSLKSLSLPPRLVGTVSVFHGEGGQCEWLDWHQAINPTRATPRAAVLTWKKENIVTDSACTPDPCQVMTGQLSLNLGVVSPPSRGKGPLAPAF
jgi:hypothetical protein